MTKLVIVESPTKIKKVQQYLPPGFIVDSCVGHIRDLPSKKSEVPAAIKDEEWADFGIDYTNGFKPVYITIRGKGKVITGLKQKLKDADELYLATDEDREGESIAWHLVEALKPKVPVRRMVFNEITKKAVAAAVENPRDMDLNLVQAQETRRILDRLYGYGLSPLLWKKIGGNLSAGRVQSVAIRLVVMRERERRAFRKGTYWDLKATLDHGGLFDAKLVELAGQRIATGKDFDKDTGRIADGKDVLLLEEAQARDLQSRLASVDWSVADVQAKQRTAKAPAPFITSSLQQDANNRLNFSAKRTMDVAQRLYQEGFITYMRTDSTSLSDEALEGAKSTILAEFGDNYYAGPRKWESKKAKGAQEAHEAIRPAGEEWQHPDRCALTGDEKKLYRLIWQRTLASQMADEQFTTTAVTLAVDDATFQANGRATDFPGFRAAYPPSGRGDDALPPMTVGDNPRCQGIEAEGHETKPPARFTEATLVRSLEEEAIGRPSTYASILDTVKRRGYVIPKGKALVPSFTAFAVVGLMEKHFPHLVDLQFTARMEQTLDAIAAGEAEWQPFLTEFFLGESGLKQDVADHMESMDAAEARIIDLGDTPYTVKIGRFGPYLEMEMDGETHNASIPETLTPDELDLETAQRLIKQRAEGPQALGTDPATGNPVYILEGRFGPYYQLGEGQGKEKPPRASLPKGKQVADATLEEGLFLLSLPRVLGDHPAGGDVIAGLGRYGPYVAHRPPGEARPDYRSIEDVEQIKHIALDEALSILAEPKKGARRGPAVLKELGEHPDGGPMRILSGRYGPYVNHGKLNATIPKDVDPNTVTPEVAVQLLADKKAKQ